MHVYAYYYLHVFGLYQNTKYVQILLGPAACSFLDEAHGLTTRVTLSGRKITFIPTVSIGGFTRLWL